MITAYLQSQSGARIQTPTPALPPVFSHSLRGAASATTLFPCSQLDAFRLRNEGGLMYLAISDGADTIWRGRVERREVTPDGFRATAFGLSRLFDDVLYTALWSRTTTAGWRAMKQSERSIIRESRFETDNNNRIYIAVKRNHKSGLNHRGGMVYELPDKGERNAVSMSFDYNILGCPGRDYRLAAVGYGPTWTPITTANFDADNSGASGSHTLTFGAGVAKCAFLWSVADNTEHIYCGDDTGDAGYAIVTNIRIKSQAGDILSSNIASALYDFVAAANPNILRGKLITPTTGDLRGEVYEDLRPSEILRRLSLADNMNWSVTDGGVFRYDAAAVSGRTWYVFVDSVTVGEDLQDIYSDIYARYSDANDRPLRTARDSNQRTIETYGVRRDDYVRASTTSATQAEAQRDARVDDAARYQVQAQIVFSRIRDGGGNVQPVWRVMPGDTLILQNLPAVSSPADDSLRRFQVAYREYDALTGRISVEPFIPTPTLVNLIAKRDAGL